MPTKENLKEAFAGESQANRKYLAYAQKAAAEGFAQVAKLFRAAAEAETVHAHAHLRAMGGIRTTADNLREALGGETHEFTAMYPWMIDAASEEGFDAAFGQVQVVVYQEEVLFQGVYLPKHRIHVKEPELATKGVGHRAHVAVDGATP